MAIIRREQQQPGRTSREWDPFSMMRELMRWEPTGQLAQLSEQGLDVDFEVKETKDAYLFAADLPGVKEEDVDISLTGNRLTVSGKREVEKKDESDRYFVYERSYGSFSRSFTLPEGVDAEHVNAELKNGVLNIRVPKKPEVQPKRIQLQGGQQGKAKA